MQKRNINLLQQRGAPPTFWEKLYDWMTNTCRIIVIITELLVLGAFGWRFWLDRSLTNLNNDIEQKGEALKNLAGQEDEIRLLQTKMDTYKQTWNVSSNLTPIFKEIRGYTSSDMEELSIRISRDKEVKTINVSGKTNRDDISDIENSLKDSENFTNVTLSSLERDSGGEDIYTFVLVANIIFDEAREPLGSDASTESET
jgi:capsular polysaccharide biosynthesis protein